MNKVLRIQCLINWSYIKLFFAARSKFGWWWVDCWFEKKNIVIYHRMFHKYTCFPIDVYFMRHPVWQITSANFARIMLIGRPSVSRVNCQHPVDARGGNDLIEGAGLELISCCILSQSLASPISRHRQWATRSRSMMWVTLIDDANFLERYIMHYILPCSFPLWGWSMCTLRMRLRF